MSAEPGIVVETPQQAARRLFAPQLRQGYKPEALHEYRNAQGAELFWRARLRTQDGGKFIRPFYLGADGYKMGEPTFDKGKPLYRLPDLHADLDSVVFVVEGEKCVDALAELGIVATTSGSSGSVAGADWSRLKGRDVFVWPDGDEPGAKYAEAVIQKLREIGAASVRVVDIRPLGLAEHGDCVDWLKAHSDATADDVLKLATVEPQGDDSKPSSGAVATTDLEGRPRPQLSVLVDIGSTHRLFSDDGEAYAKAERGCYAVASAEYREILGREFYRLTGKGANRNALSDAINTLSAVAKFDGPSERVFLRAGEHDGTVVIDAGTAQWDGYQITAGGWRHVDKLPVNFRRAGRPRPLPTPKEPDFSRLWDYVNVAPEHRVLVAGWLLAALRPRGPYPILLLVAEQGSGKSSMTRTLKAITDPSRSPLRSPPKDERDLLVAAVNSRVLALDNLSGVDHQLSDALCRLSTGGALSGRKLYSDADETLIEVQRPVILNGIDDIASRPDLAERCLHISLPPITARRPEAELAKAFEADAPAIFAALLDGVALALKDADSLDIGPLPRMADFAKWAAAGMPALGFTAEQFADAYRENQAQAVEVGLESSTVGSALRVLMSGRDEWQGTASDLLRTLSEVAGDGATSRAWPRSAKGMVNALRRLAPALRHVGITWESTRNAHNRALKLCKVAGQVSQASQVSSASDGMTLMTHNQPPCTHDAEEF